MKGEVPLLTASGRRATHAGSWEITAALNLPVRRLEHPAVNGSYRDIKVGECLL